MPLNESTDTAEGRSEFPFSEQSVGQAEIAIEAIRTMHLRIRQDINHGANLGASCADNNLSSGDGPRNTTARRRGAYRFFVLRPLALREAYAYSPRFAIGGSYVGHHFLNMSHRRNFLQHIDNIYGPAQEDQN